MLRTAIVVALASSGLALAANAPARVQSKCPIYSNSLFFQERPYAKKRLRYESLPHGAELGAGEQRSCRLEPTADGWRAVITRREVTVVSIVGMPPRAAVTMPGAHRSVVYVWRFSRCAKIVGRTRAAERRLVSCLRRGSRNR